MSKKLAVAVLGMSVVVAGVAWKRTLENSATRASHTTGQLT